MDWQQYTVHRWQNNVYGLQFGEILSLVYMPGLVALETSSRVAKYCGITGSSQITFSLLITLPDVYRVQEKSSTAVRFTCILIFVIAIFHIRKKLSAEV